MKKIQVSTATNSQLDWLVAKCESVSVWIDADLPNYPHVMETPSNDVWGKPRQLTVEDGGVQYEPTINPAQMWPIIEREGISTVYCFGDLGEPREYWAAFSGGQSWSYAYGPYHEQDEEKSLSLRKEEAATGPTALIAAARCYVMSKLGKEVEVPEELL